MQGVMHHKKLSVVVFTVLFAWMMGFATSFAWAAEGGWDSDDFTYGWWDANYQYPGDSSPTNNTDIHPASDTEDKMSIHARAVTGFSEKGFAKFNEGLTDLVIPTVDDEGMQICAVANNAFSGSNLGKLTDKRITSVVFPENVKTTNEKRTEKWNPDLEMRGNFWIGASAFSGNDISGRLVLPEGVIYIGPSGFSKNPGITEVVFPETITWIMGSAFGNANSSTGGEGMLERIGFPEKTDFPLQTGQQAFGGNSIKSAQFPSNTAIIQKWIFSYNPGMESLPNGVPANLRKFDAGMVHVYVTDTSKLAATGGSIMCQPSESTSTQKLFQGTVSAEHIPWCQRCFTYSEDNATVTGLSALGKQRMKIDPDMILPNYGPNGTCITAIGPGVSATQGAFTFTEDGTTYSPASVELPSNVETIESFAFASPRFTKVTFPKQLKTIAADAFANGAFTRLSIPESLTTLDNFAFRGNQNAGRSDGKVVLVTYSDDQASGTGTYAGVVPNGNGHIIESIGWTPACFTYNGATVTGLTELGKEMLKAKDGALVIPDQNADGIPTTVIGEGSFSTAGTAAGTFGYLDTDGTWVYPKTVVFPSNLKEIGKAAFSGVYVTNTSEAGTTTETIIGGLTEVDLPDTLTTIGDAAFNWAPLTKVIIPDSVTSIGKGAFATAMNLPGTITEAKLPTGITTIPEYLFNNQELTSIEIPSTVKTIERGAFRENPLTSLSIPNGVETIGTVAFQNHALTSLIIPGSVKTIGNEAFNVSGHNGGSLASLTLNEGLESIGTRAFQGASLKVVTIPTSLKTLATRAFNNNKNADRADSRVVLVSSSYKQMKGEGDYAKFIPEESFTDHHGGGHVTVLDLSKATVDAIKDQDYAAGKEIKPVPVVKWTDGTKLVAGEDYTVSYANNTKAGKATITLKGTAGADIAQATASGFVKTKTATFTIKEAPKPVTTKAAIKSATAPAQKYTGKALKPAVTVKDANGKTVPASAYTVTYANNTYPGTATATVKAKANSKYTGTVKATFKITAAEQGVYWLVNKKTGENLYTTAVKEVNTLSKVKKTWTNKGIMWYAPTVGDPIYRLVNKKTGDHHFTKSTNEVRVLTKVKKTWTADFNGKPIFYSGGPKKVWRQYSDARQKAGKPGTHKFTTYNAKLKGWKNEGALIEALRYGKVNGVK